MKTNYSINIMLLSVKFPQYSRFASFMDSAGVDSDDGILPHNDTLYSLSADECSEKTSQYILLSIACFMKSLQYVRSLNVCVSTVVILLN